MIPHLKLHAPKLSWLWLGSNVLLMAGATIFVLACPQRVKDFTRLTWKHGGTTGPDHVYAYAFWERPIWRIACGLCFGFGGAGVLYFLLSKIVRLFEFALAG